MTPFTKLAAAVALAMPVITFAQDAKPDAKPEKQETKQTEAKAERSATKEIQHEAQVSVDGRTKSVIINERNAVGDVVVRVEAINDQTKAELEQLRSKLTKEARAELDRAMKEVEATKTITAKEIERAKAEGAKARAMAESDIAKAKGDILKLQDANRRGAVAGGGGGGGGGAGTVGGPNRLRISPERKPAKVELENAAYLGVGGSPVDEALRTQLNLPKGVGLLVQAVEDGSPAQSAGLKRFDVLHKLNDQLLINTHQLAVLVRAAKPGDEVKLAYYRGGKEETKTVKLAEKQLPVLGSADARDGFDWDIPPMPHVADVQIGKINDLVLKLHQDADGKSGFISRAVASDGKRMIVQADGDYGISLSNNDGKRTLRITDTKTGKELFNGPIDTEEDRAKIPDDLKDKVRILDNASKIVPGFNLNLDGKIQGKFDADVNGFGGGFGGGGFGKGDLRREFNFNNEFRWEGGKEFKFDGGDFKRKSSPDRQDDAKAMEWDEPNMKLRVERRDGKKNLIATDTDGKELFAGPIDTEAQRKALPDSVREKLDSGKWQSIQKQLDE